MTGVMTLPSRLAVRRVFQRYSLTCRSCQPRTRTISLSRWSSAAAEATLKKEDPMPLPSANENERIYSPKITDLVNSISELTLLEVSDLNALLKKRLNIPDMAPMMAAMPVGGIGAGGQQAEEEEASVGPRTVAVKIVGFEDAKKIQLIKELKTISGDMNLVQAKKFVETLPQIFRGDLPKEEAEKLKAQLEAAGAKVEIA